MKSPLKLSDLFNQLWLGLLINKSDQLIAVLLRLRKFQTHPTKNFKFVIRTSLFDSFVFLSILNVSKPFLYVVELAHHLDLQLRSKFDVLRDHFSQTN